MIAPWTSGADDLAESDAINAAVILSYRWKNNQESRKGFGTEHTAVLRAISDFIDRHGDSRFSDIKAMGEAPMVRDRAGYWDDWGGASHLPLQWSWIS